LDGAQAAANFLRDHVGIQLAVDGRRLGLDGGLDGPLACALAGLCARDAGATARAARVGHTARARAARLDAAQRVVTAGDADAADALERVLLIAVDVALAEDVSDGAAAVRLRAQQLEEAGRLDLLGQSRAPLGVGLS